MLSYNVQTFVLETDDRFDVFDVGLFFATPLRLLQELI